MKKMLVTVALVASMVLPAAAADMKTMAEEPVAGVPAYCYFLPLLPDCVTAWKAKADEEKAKWDAMKSK